MSIHEASQIVDANSATANNDNASTDAKAAPSAATLWPDYTRESSRFPVPANVPSPRSSNAFSPQSSAAFFPIRSWVQFSGAIPPAAAAEGATTPEPPAAAEPASLAAKPAKVAKADGKGGDLEWINLFVHELVYLHALSAKSALSAGQNFRRKI
jgi:hypothetical protein